MRVKEKPTVRENLPTINEVQETIKIKYLSLTKLKDTQLKEWQEHDAKPGSLDWETPEEESKRRYRDNELKLAYETTRAQMVVLLELWQPFKEYQEWHQWKNNEDAVDKMMAS